MFIYNTTFHVEDEILEDAIVFFKGTYIPQALASGELSEPRMALIHRQHEESGTSFSLQFNVEDVDSLNNWFQTDGRALHQKMTGQFSNKITGFNTLLEEIDLDL